MSDSTSTLIEVIKHAADADGEQYLVSSFYTLESRAEGIAKAVLEHQQREIPVVDDAELKRLGKESLKGLMALYAQCPDEIVKDVHQRVGTYIDALYAKIASTKREAHPAGEIPAIDDSEAIASAKRAFDNAYCAGGHTHECVEQAIYNYKAHLPAREYRDETPTWHWILDLPNTNGALESIRDFARKRLKEIEGGES